MRIETYSEKYCHDVIKVVENFHEEALREYEATFTKVELIDTITQLKDQNAENAFLLIIDDTCQGLLAGVESKSMINGGRLFQEIIWYVNPPFRRYGVTLLKEVENLLKSRGISIMIMAVLENSKTEKIKSLYERVGYKPMETHYMKAF